MATSALEFVISAKDEASKVFDSIGNAAGRQQAKLDKFSRGAQVGLAGLTVLAVKFGTESVNAYADAEESQKLLETAYTRFPKLAQTNIEALRGINDALQAKTGFDNDETAAAQATLAQYNLTGDQIAKLTPLLQDYAAKTGKDLVTAAGDLGKATMGQGRALKAVGIDMTNTGTTAGNLDQIMAGLTEKVGGTAEALGDTAAGKSKILGAQFEDLEESVGGLLLPALGKVVDVSLKVVNAFNRTGKGGQIVIGIFAGLALALAAASVAAKANIIIQGIQAVLSGNVAAATGLQTLALGAQKVALAVSTGAQWAFNAAMSANPIGLVIIAIAALAAGFIWAYNNVGWFKTGVDAIGAAFVWLWDTILFPYIQAFTTVWTWMWENVMKPVFDFIVAYVKLVGDVWSWLWTNAIKPAIDGIVSGLGWMKDRWSDTFTIVKGIVTGAADAIKSTFQNVLDFFRAAPGKIGGFFSGVGDSIKGAFKSAFNGVAGLWNNSVGKLSFTVPSWVPSIGGKSWSLPKMPTLYTGGQITGEGWAQVGERGPEMVRLPRGATVYSNQESKKFGAGQGSSGSDPELLQAVYRLIEVTKERATMYAPDGTVLAKSATSGQKFLAALGATA